MYRLGGVQKISRGAGTRHGGRDLPCHMARFADATDDDATMALQNQIDGAGEAGIQPLGLGGDGIGFDAEHAPRHVKRAICIRWCWLAGRHVKGVFSFSRRDALLEKCGWMQGGGRSSWSSP